MLNENIRRIRKEKGLSQQELATKLNVVRQTVSKWEQGLSVPDTNMLLSLSEALDTPVNVLLEEITEQTEEDLLKVISETLENLQLQLDRSRSARRKRLTIVFGLIAIAAIAGFVFFMMLDSPYLGWDYTDPEKAVVGVLFHALEWLFVRLSPVVLIGAITGIYLIWKK